MKSGKLGTWEVGPIINMCSTTLNQVLKKTPFFGLIGLSAFKLDWNMFADSHDLKCTFSLLSEIKRYTNGLYQPSSKSFHVF